MNETSWFCVVTFLSGKDVMRFMQTNRALCRVARRRLKQMRNPKYWTDRISGHPKDIQEAIALLGNNLDSRSIRSRIIRTQSENLSRCLAEAVRIEFTQTSTRRGDGSSRQRRNPARYLRVPSATRDPIRAQPRSKDCESASPSVLARRDDQWANTL